MKKPIIPILLFYTAGILFGRYLPLYLIPLTIFIIIILAAYLLFNVVSSKQYAVCSKRLPTAYFLLPTFILAGAAAINYQSMTLPENHISVFLSGEKVTIEGVLYKSPQDKGCKTESAQKL
ncbi:MAG: hypothetical protein HY097_04110 [Nitrospinae bacterium]|nr:hypothetical protein [Nitrospinota bacterium]